MTDEQPELDYWMLGILDECAKTEIKRLSSRWSAKYVKNQLEARNKWTPLGQLQVIRDRLNEMRVHTDKKVK